MRYAPDRINKEDCLEALKNLKGLPKEEQKGFEEMCNEGVSIAQLFRGEIPKKGSCTSNDARKYIHEEELQMHFHTNVPYNMDTISVAEHVYAEQKLEPEHAGLYVPVSGDVKFFQEWLEGHHPSLGCLYSKPNEVPPDSYYVQLALAREEAKRYRK
jgi:hypothetical protein